MDPVKSITQIFRARAARTLRHNTSQTIVADSGHNIRQFGFDISNC